MPTKKISDLEPWTIQMPVCSDPEHNPPDDNHMIFEPGVWEHTCPNCGYAQRFIVTGQSWTTK